MGHKYSRDEILDGALQTAFSEGLSRITFGRIARRLGTSDRVVVYYFPSKSELISAVLTALAGQLQALLAVAFTSPAPDHRALIRSAWPVLATGEVDPIFGLYFEAIGQATAGIEPFAGLAEKLVESWINWLAEFFDGDLVQRRAEAEATLALLDGLLLLRQIAGHEAADRAAALLGVR